VSESKVKVAAVQAAPVFLDLEAGLTDDAKLAPTARYGCRHERLGHTTGAARTLRPGTAGISAADATPGVPRRRHVPTRKTLST
jgi:hypothetical protein